MQNAGALQLKAAIASGDFRGARALWCAYAEAISASARNGQLDEATLADLARLIEWTKDLALMTRAHALARIGQCDSACRVAGAYSAATR